MKVKPVIKEVKDTKKAEPVVKDILDIDTTAEADEEAANYLKTASAVISALVLMNLWAPLIIHKYRLNIR